MGSLNLNVPQQIFVLFYAIFWGTMANALPKWKAFAVPYVFYDAPSVRRVSLAIFTLNVLPIVFFVIVLKALGGSVWQVQKWEVATLVKILASLVPAFGIFGFYKVWMSLMQFWPNTFYSFTVIGGVQQPDQELYANLRNSDLDRRWACGNLLFGFLYIILGLAVPVSVSLVCTGTIW
jgi:hypothetical protein